MPGVLVEAGGHILPPVSGSAMRVGGDCLRVRDDELRVKLGGARVWLWSIERRGVVHSGQRKVGSTDGPMRWAAVPIGSHTPMGVLRTPTWYNDVASRVDCAPSNGWLVGPACVLRGRRAWPSACPSQLGVSDAWLTARASVLDHAPAHFSGAPSQVRRKARCP